MEQLVFTAFLNRLFGPAVLTLLQALHIHPKHPATPISNSFAMELLVVLLLTLFFIAVRARLSVERPGGLQHTMEMIDGVVHGIARETISDHPEQFVPYLTALGLFILVCNLIGLVPGLESPTAVPIVPLGCALFTWFYYHYYGVRANGPIGYLKHFIGPQEGMPLAVRLLLPILLFPIELFSHAARVLSLTVRLFANMFAGEMVTLVFFSLLPLGLPVVFEGLHIGACVYLGEATAHEH
jgi:F-type H+-transporting ATPase subunit a